MSRVRWQNMNTVLNEKVRSRCRVENLEHRLRKTRLRWIGHVKRGDENNILKSVMELEVEGRRPVGRPKKTWSVVVEKGMRRGSHKVWQRIENNGGNSYHVQPQVWETRDTIRRL